MSLCVLTAIGERGVLHLWRLTGEKARLDEENYRLQKENEGLRQRISKLRNDNFYLEKMAREELNLCAPGKLSIASPQRTQKKIVGELSAAILPNRARQRHKNHPGKRFDDLFAVGLCHAN